VLVLTLFVYEWAVQNDLASPLLATTSPLMRYICYALLLLAAAGGFAYDWQEMGPTLALKRSLVTTLVAWLLIVPMGVVSELFLSSVWFVGILSMGCFAASMAHSGITSCFQRSSLASSVLTIVTASSILIASWFVATHQSQFKELEHVIGIVMIFVLTNIAVRFATRVAMEKLEPVATWPGVTQVDKDSSEFQEKLEFFEAAAAAYAQKYSFWLHLEELYKVAPAGKPSGQSPLKRTTEGQLLFHGTRREAAHGIIQDGFRLPEHHGMFGKGIYFADCPLKSWQYTGMMSGMLQLQTGIILLCWVELGRRSHQKAARSSFTRPPRRSFLEWIRQEERYTSVVGDDKDAGGALRVPEYVVYDIAKVQVDYICEVKSVRPGTARTPAPSAPPMA